MIKKNVIRRTFKGAKNPDAPLRQKAPKIQRLITDVRIRRKRIQKQDKVKRWKKTLAATEEYKKVYDKWIAKRKAAAHQAKVARKASLASGTEKAAESKSKPKDVKKGTETKADPKIKKADTGKKTEDVKKVDTTKKAPETKKTEPVKKVDSTKDAGKKV